MAYLHTILDILMFNKTYFSALDASLKIFLAKKFTNGCSPESSIKARHLHLTVAVTWWHTATWFLRISDIFTNCKKLTNQNSGKNDSRQTKRIGLVADYL